MTKLPRLEIKGEKEIFHWSDTFSFPCNAIKSQRASVSARWERVAARFLDTQPKFVNP